MFWYYIWHSTQTGPSEREEECQKEERIEERKGASRADAMRKTSAGVPDPSWRIRRHDQLRESRH